MAQRLARYGSPSAVAKALIAAQNRISSGELRPTLGKNPSAEELAEWRTAHGIPESADKYDLGKDVQIADTDKPFFDALFKNAHAAHATPEMLKAVAKTWNEARQAIIDHRAGEDNKSKQAAEDSLRAEWGNDFRRNVNLVHGLLDGAGSQKLKGAVLDARMADGKRLGDSPEAMKMLLGLALINNPTGVVVEGGSGVTGEGIRQEIEKIQKIPAAKRSEEQSKRQRDLIDAAIKAGIMDGQGNWKQAA